MTSAKRVEANRRNSAKSTGPKAEAGKARSARNAVTHGMTAQPVIEPTRAPEAPDGYRESLRQWVDDLRPSGVVERALVERGCRAAWRLGRCALQEDAAIARRARDAADRHDREAEARADWLGRRLLKVAPIPGPNRCEPVDEGDDPGSLLSELKSTAQGVAWLLVRWDMLRRVLEDLGTWDTDRMVAAIRMIGRRPEDVLDDTSVLAIVTSVHSLKASKESFYLDCFQVLGIDPRIPSQSERAEVVRWRIPDQETAAITLKGLVEQSIAELQHIKSRVLDGRAAADREAAASLTFLEAGPAATLLLRYETASSRELHRALGDLAKIRKAAITSDSADRAENRGCAKVSVAVEVDAPEESAGVVEEASAASHRNYETKPTRADVPPAPRPATARSGSTSRPSVDDRSSRKIGRVASGPGDLRGSPGARPARGAMRQR